MDQRVRLEDIEEGIREYIKMFLDHTWTAMPGVVQSWDSTANTVDVQITVASKFRSSENGAWETAPTTILQSVPVVFGGGGNFVVTFPIAVGDECLVVFADRCIDSWFAHGIVNNKPAIPPRVQSHSLSDGFAFFGPRSVPRQLTNISTTAAQIRSLDGTITINLNADGSIGIVSPIGIKLDAPVITVDGPTPITASPSSPTLSLPVTIGETVMYIPLKSTP